MQDEKKGNILVKIAFAPCRKQLDVAGQCPERRGSSSTSNPESKD